MSHTHLLYHLVFATKDRMRLIQPVWEGELFSYMAGIIRNHEGRSLEINGDADHIHVLGRLTAKESLSDFMRELKAGSSRFVRRKYYPKFAWQRRYGAFTVSESAAEAVRRYIRNQKEHHRKQLFEDEYASLLVKHNIDFDERYLWD